MRLTLLLAVFITLQASAVAQSSLGDKTCSQLETADSLPRPDRGESTLDAVSLTRLPARFGADQKRIWTFPARAIRGDHSKAVLALVGATAGLVALDPPDTPYFRRTGSFHDFNRVLSGRNAALGMAILPASFFVAGLAKHRPYEQHTALLAGEAAADSLLLATVMKAATRRLRPSDIPPNGDFSDSWYRYKGGALAASSSFPSGHAIAAFSIATIFAERYISHRWAPWVAYGLAGLVGFSRLTLQAHFPSDIFMGAALGFSISHFVVLRR